MTKKALIITSIAGQDHPVLKRYAAESPEQGFDFIVMGDTKSPANFQLEGCDFWSVDRQLKMPFSLAKSTPTRHYSRKNLGYLMAAKNGCEEILETDDDNIPAKGFWRERNREEQAAAFENTGWMNVYDHFTATKIWPRGLPLEELQRERETERERRTVVCPIQQGLADENPDVDAVYRLTYPLPVRFEKKARLALGRNAWSPFNSQNTYWFREAFPLMYLPSFCSFRATDIWRSYVAQRVAWECGWSILYHEPTVTQERNEHSLLKDFEDELPVYLQSAKIARELQDLSLQSGTGAIFSNLQTCYAKMVEIEAVGKEELGLLKAWISDLEPLL